MNNVQVLENFHAWTQYDWNYLSIVFGKEPYMFCGDFRFGTLRSYEGLNIIIDN